jgi:hypothetical protein
MQSRKDKKIGMKKLFFLPKYFCRIPKHFQTTRCPQILNDKNNKVKK